MIIKKLISRIYKKLLEWLVAEKLVKDYMTKWAVNFNRTIEIQSWEYLMKTSNKIATCFQIKENVFKMQSR